jgi:hypothetical protein
MELKIKNLKTFRSTDGYGFNATLYADNKKAGLIMSNADGGEMNICWENGFSYLGDKLNEEAEERHPDFAYGAMDILISSMIDDLENYKWLKRNCKKQTLFTIPTDKKENYRTLKMEYGQKAKDYLAKNHPRATIVNENIVAPSLIIGGR